MNLCCIKCLKQRNNNTQTKLEVDGKITIYSYYVDPNFKKFEIIDKKEVTDLLKSSNYMKNNVTLLFEVYKKCRKQKITGCKDKYF